jgi:hypothetical protein
MTTNRRQFIELSALAGSFAICRPAVAEAFSLTPDTSNNYSPAQRPLSSYDREVHELLAMMTLEEKISQIGHTADAVPRLGIPEYNWWNEGLHGVARAGKYASISEGRRHVRGVEGRRCVGERTVIHDDRRPDGSVSQANAAVGYGEEFVRVAACEE